MSRRGIVSDFTVQRLGSYYVWSIDTRFFDPLFACHRRHGRPQSERDVMPHFAAGRIVPLISRVYPLEQAAEAHRAMEAGEHFGKLVLSIAARDTVRADRPR